MGISDRIEGTIENWRVKWGDILKGWLVNILSFGLEVFMNILGKAFAPKLKPFIEKLEATGEVPPELQPLLSEVKSPTGQIASILAYSVGGTLVGGAIGKVTDALFLRLGYSLMRTFHPVLPTIEQALAYWLRHPEWTATLNDVLKAQGAEDLTAAVLKDLSQARLDVASITALWRRDKELYEPLWKDLQDQGISPARISFLKELAKIIPPLPDMVRFADFGAFDPEIIEMWREFYDAPGWIKEPMSKIGIEGEWADKYWFSHWRQPGRFELGEMHRRGLIDDDIVKNAYLTQGFSSFWQDNLLELVKETWTRVDIRRMWDMRTISEDEMRKAYRARGYYDEWLEGIVLWTKIYVAFPDLLARWSKGWITIDDIRSELTGLGMPAARVEEMIQTKIKAVQPEKVTAARDLTTAQIIRWVKLDEAERRGQGIELLVDLNYTAEQADFIMEGYLGEMGSPETFEDFKNITAKYRRAIGMETKPMSEELKAAAAEVVKLTKDVEALEAAIVEEEAKLVGEEILPEEATAKRDELRVSLHRAESALAMAKSNYDKLLAEWRHKES